MNIKKHYRRKVNLRKTLQSFYWHFYVLRKNPNLMQMIGELKKNQYLSADELEYLNWQKRKRIVAFAYENVPYYKERYKKYGFHPSELKKPDDFLKVPLLTRDCIKYNLEKMVAIGIDRTRLRPLGTGGTTGMPLKVYQDKNNDTLFNALSALMLSWWGTFPWTDSAWVFRVMKQHSKVKINENDISNNSYNLGLISKLKILIYNRIRPVSHLLDASFMDENSVNKFLENIKNDRPLLIQGYVGAIDFLATYIERKKQIGCVSPDAVWVTSAPLTKIQKRHNENVFGCPVYDQYGTVEVYWLAAECREQDGLHVFSDVRHIEFLDSKYKPTEPNIDGKVVVTDLENYAAPIIRYVNGDRGSRKTGKCSCGVNLPLINGIKGRESDKVILPDGTVIAGEYLTTIFDDYADEIRNFQVRHVSTDKLVIQIVMAKIDHYHHIIRKVSNELENKVKGQMRIEFQQVKNIKHDRGKYRYIINDLAKLS